MGVDQERQPDKLLQVYNHDAHGHNLSNIDGSQHEQKHSRIIFKSPDIEQAISTPMQQKHSKQRLNQYRQSQILAGEDNLLR